MLNLTDAVGTVVWQSSTDNVNYTTLGDSAPFLYYMATNILSTTYYQAVATSEGCPPAISNSQVVTINPTPIGGSISGDGSVCSGTNTKTLTLQGSTGSIQWQSSTDNITFTPISGATSATYTATNTAVTTYYNSVLTIGSCTATSNTVMIQVVPSAVAGTISGAGTVCFGSNTKELILSGYTGTIQWQTSDDNVTFTDIPGETNYNYFAFDLIATTYYRAVVTTSCGTATTTSVTITVNHPSDGGIISGDATVCYGTNSTTLTVNNNIGTIQWQSSPNDTTYTNISGATASTYTVTNLTATTYYRVAATNSPCSVGYSISVPIIVQSVPTAGAIGSDQTINNAGDPALFTSTTSGTGDGTITYIWQSAVSPFTTWNTIASANAETYDVPSGLTVTTKYRRITVSTLNGTACQSIPTNSVTVTVQAVPTGGTVGTSTAICYGYDPAAFTVSVAATGSGTLTYQWQSSSDNVNWVDIAGATNSIYDVPNGFTTLTYYRRIVTSTLNGNTATAISNVITLTVNTTPFVSTQTTSACSGSAFTVSPVNGVTSNIVPSGTTYTWSAPVVTGGLTGGAAGTAQASITGTLTNPTNVPQTATYTVTPTSGSAGKLCWSNLHGNGNGKSKTSNTKSNGSNMQWRNLHYYLNRCYPNSSHDSSIRYYLHLGCTGSYRRCNRRRCRNSTKHYFWNPY
jgi:hypothetical protein